MKDEVKGVKMNKEKGSYHGASPNINGDSNGNDPAAGKRINGKRGKRTTSNGKRKKHAGRKMKNKANGRKKLANEKPKKHKCRFCSYALSDKWKLLMHNRTHTGDPPFHFNICSKEFSTKNHLNRHKKVHYLELPFNCLKCHRRFAQDNDRIN